MRWSKCRIVYFITGILFIGHFFLPRSPRLQLLRREGEAAGLKSLLLLLLLLFQIAGDGILLLQKDGRQRQRRSRVLLLLLQWPLREQLHRLEWRAMLLLLLLSQ